MRLIRTKVCCLPSVAALSKVLQRSEQESGVSWQRWCVSTSKNPLLVPRAWLGIPKDATNSWSQRLAHELLIQTHFSEEVTCTLHSATWARCFSEPSATSVFTKRLKDTCWLIFKWCFKDSNTLWRWQSHDVKHYSSNKIPSRWGRSCPLHISTVCSPLRSAGIQYTAGIDWHWNNCVLGGS